MLKPRIQSLSLPMFALQSTKLDIIKSTLAEAASKYKRLESIDHRLKQGESGEFSTLRRR